MAEIEDSAGGEVTITAIVRDEYRRYVPGGSWAILPDDLLVVEADPQALEQFISDGQLELVGSKELPEVSDPEKKKTEPKREAALVPPEIDPNRLTVIEAVVTAESRLIGHSAAELQLRERYGVNILAIGRRGRRTMVRLRRVNFLLGDAIVFQGRRATVNQTLAELGCLPLAERQLQLGRRRQLVLPVVILAMAMVMAAFRIVPAEIAFVGAAVAIVLLGLLTLNEVYSSIEWPILILIGALIPIGEAVKSTGTTDLLTGLLSGFAAIFPDTAFWRSFSR